MRTSTLPLAAALLLAAGCKDYSELYCDEDTPCTDPARPFCDLRGEHPASEGIGKTCIPSPFGPDAGTTPDSGTEPDASGPERIVEVAAGFSHTCARTNHGRVRCWGYKPMLGWDAPEDIGDDEYPRDGQDVPLPEPALQLAVTESHSCALTASKRIICWGASGGALGIPSGDRNTPPDQFADVPGKFKEVTVGQGFTCGLLESGDVRCWGRNERGQLGIGSSEAIGDDESAGAGPLVALPGPATSIRAQGGSYACALIEGGTVSCWGANDEGTLGLGHTRTIGDDETPIDGGNAKVGLQVASIDTGGHHTCALSTGGHVRCWGANAEGRLGRGEETDPIIGDELDDMPPPSVEIEGTVTAIELGSYQSCVLLENQTLRCWGSAGANGQSETWGDDEPLSDLPVVSVGAPVARVSAGTSHTCVVTGTASVRCWGANFTGSLGYATTEPVGDDEAPAVYGDVPVFPDL